jgi:hypothetical protein
MKTKLLIASVLGSILISFSAQAQNMGAVNTKFDHRPVDMHQIREVQMQLIHKGMAQASTSLHNPTLVFKVILKDSTSREIKSKIFFDERNASYLLAEDKKLRKDDPMRVQRIYPADTRAIYKVRQDGLLLPVGMPADSCWLFKVVHGKINAYSFLPATANLHTGYFKFVQKDNGDLKKLDIEVLKTMVQDNHKAMMLTYDNRFYEAMVEYNSRKPNKK